MPVRGGDEPDGVVINFADAKDDVASRVPEVTIENYRRYSPNTCKHRGPYVIDEALNVVECRDCGANLNPMYVLSRIAYGEAYWNQRAKDRRKYLDELEKEVARRERTRCTHCGNMTAIRYETKAPQTWVRDPHN